MLNESTTEILIAAQTGDAGAVEKLFPIVYDELKTIARNHLQRNPLANELSSSDLVHEAYIKLVDQKKVSVRSRTHFFALGSRVMRQLLVDRARRNMAARRGGGKIHLALDDQLINRKSDRDVLALEQALEQLEEIDPRQASIVEMRFFGGMTVAEVATQLEKSKRWVEAEWTMIRAWLRKEIKET